MDSRQKKFTAIGTLCVVLLIIIWITIVEVGRIGKVAVTVLAHPEDSIVLVNGDRIRGKTIYLTPGEYTFSATNEGWSDDTATITISEDIDTVGLLPRPDSYEARELLDDINIQHEREAIASVAANARGLDIRTANPILDKLPRSDITGPYKIDYGFNRDDGKTPYLIVSFSTPNGRQAALSWLTNNDVNITETEIIFSDFTNPIRHGEHHHD